MTDIYISSLIQNLPGNYVIFTLTEHMLKNSEMNATQEVRTFLLKENILDFSTISRGMRINMPVTILTNNQSFNEEITFRSPPHKYEARMWIYNFTKYAAPNEQVLMTKLDSSLIIIPLNQLPTALNRLLLAVNSYEDKMLKQIKQLAKNPKFKAYKRDYIKEVTTNRDIGLAGELFVYQLEKNNLISNGQIELAKLVEHKSVTEGDGLGYDILSFNREKKEQFIEVKTTTGNLKTPFYMTPNEVSFYKNYPNSYYLYRVYDFDQNHMKGKILIINTDLESKIDFSTNNFRCTFKKEWLG